MDERRRTVDDDREFDAIYRREIHTITALATSLTGSREIGADLAHEAMTRTFRSWAHVRTLDRPGAWLRRVVINLAIDAHRRRQREASAIRRLSAVPRPAEPGASSAAASAQFWAAVRELPERQRAVVALHYVDELTVTEIAQVLDISDGTVKSSLHRARAKLAETLGAEEVTG